MNFEHELTSKKSKSKSKGNNVNGKHTERKECIKKDKDSIPNDEFVFFARKLLLLFQFSNVLSTYLQKFKKSIKGFETKLQRKTKIPSEKNDNEFENPFSFIQCLIFLLSFCFLCILCILFTFFSFFLIVKNFTMTK